MIAKRPAKVSGITLLPVKARTLPPKPLAALLQVSSELEPVATRTRESFDAISGPWGVVPCAVAMFATDPASTSACVTVYAELVQVRLAPGARVVVGHVTV